MRKLEKLIKKCVNNKFSSLYNQVCINEKFLSILSCIIKQLIIAVDNLNNGNHCRITHEAQSIKVWRNLTIPSQGVSEIYFHRPTVFFNYVRIESDRY